MNSAPTPASVDQFHGADAARVARVVHDTRIAGTQRVSHSTSTGITVARSQTMTSHAGRRQRNTASADSMGSS